MKNLKPRMAWRSDPNQQAISSGRLLAAGFSAQRIGRRLVRTIEAEVPSRDDSSFFENNPAQARIVTNTRRKIASPINRKIRGPGLRLEGDSSVGPLHPKIQLRQPDLSLNRLEPRSGQKQIPIRNLTCQKKS